MAHEHKRLQEKWIVICYVSHFEKSLAFSIAELRGCWKDLKFHIVECYVYALK